MPVRSELHIVIPGICGPLAETKTLEDDPAVRQWVSVLSRSTQLSSADNINDVIASIFSMHTENDFPSAALSLFAHGSYDPCMFYMHADPVHLQADMDSAVLSSSDDLDIDDTEAVVLCDMLNQHFERDGMTFIALNKDQWYVSSSEKIRLITTSLTEAVGRNINFILPRGENSAHWKKLLTEAQMLMFSHALNNKRENSGLLSINSLWFHGSGNLADVDDGDRTITGICSDRLMLKGLARFIGCSHVEMPASVDAYIAYLLSCQQGAKNVLYLSDLEHLVNYTDTRPWLSKLSHVLDDWFYPILKTANKNNITVTLYPCNGNSYQFSRLDYVKFWRKHTLENHVSCY
ncbi:MAG: hypothetical protein RQ982_05070 [Gammaproteobacteria bacterium]|nr:hypothetical protein [Gammaproteobacteria bacterium]